MLVVWLAACSPDQPAQAPQRSGESEKDIQERVQWRADCDALIERINERLERINEQAKNARKEGATAAVLEVADEYEALAQSIRDLPIETQNLSLLADRYELMARRVASTARDIADQAVGRDQAALETSQHKFDQLVAEEGTIVAQINAYCEDAPQEQAGFTRADGALGV